MKVLSLRYTFQDLPCDRSTWRLNKYKYNVNVGRYILCSDVHRILRAVTATTDPDWGQTLGLTGVGDVLIQCNS